MCYKKKKIHHCVCFIPGKMSQTTSSDTDDEVAFGTTSLNYEVWKKDVSTDKENQTPNSKNYDEVTEADKTFMIKWLIENNRVSSALDYAMWMELEYSRTPLRGKSTHLMVRLMEKFIENKEYETYDMSNDMKRQFWSAGVENDLELMDADIEQTEEDLEVERGLLRKQEEKVKANAG